jgi:hypothetical protein
VAPPIMYLVLYQAVGLVKKVDTASAAVASLLWRAPHVWLLPLESEEQPPGRLCDHRVWLVLKTTCATAIAASILMLPALVFWGYSMVDAVVPCWNRGSQS